jgi:hypothetical protein
MCPLLRWKSSKYYIFWVCFCSLRYPARNTHAPYCHLLPVRLHHIFLRYLINGTIFWNKLFNIKCVFCFSLQILSEIFVILRRIQDIIVINLRRLHVKYPPFLSDFYKNLNFLDRFFKTLKYQISLKSVQWEPSRVIRTNRHTDVTKLIVAFCNFGKALENSKLNISIHWKRRLVRPNISFRMRKISD